MGIGILNKEKQAVKEQNIRFFRLFELFHVRMENMEMSYFLFGGKREIKCGKMIN